MSLQELTALYVFLQIIAENVDQDQINAVEITENEDGISKYKHLGSVVHDIPEINMRFTTIHNNRFYEEGIKKDINVVFVNNLSNNDKVSDIIFRSNKGFNLLRYV